jgi:hypothetical protein
VLSLSEILSKTDSFLGFVGLSGVRRAGEGMKIEALRYSNSTLSI